uniref:Uncharacterized protein n=1 Tax=Octopus bimaculoides TaxID=37653 RepID=A0A0L8GCA1_OCTBM
MMALVRQVVMIKINFFSKSLTETSILLIHTSLGLAFILIDGCLLLSPTTHSLSYWVHFIMAPTLGYNHYTSSTSILLIC